MIASRYREPAIALLLFTAAMLYFHQTMHLTLDLRDEGYLLFNIQRVAHGEIPHRDFDEVYGPGVYALTAPVFALFGERVFPLRYLIAAFKAAAVVLAYLISRRFMPRPFALLAAAVGVAFWGWSIWTLMTPYASLFTIPLCMLSLFLVLNGQARERPGAYVAAGVVGGVALLFKWTLAAISIYGIALAICAEAMLRNRTNERAAAGRAGVLLLWGLLAAILVVPFAAKLTAFEYLLHFAPIHAVMLVVAFGFWRHGDGAAAFARAVPRVARYGASCLLAPLLVLAIYASLGSLGHLIDNTLLRPFNLTNYALAVRPPRLPNLALLVAIASVVVSALLAIRRSYAKAAVFAVLGALLLPIGLPALKTATLAFAMESLILQLPAILMFSTLPLLALLVARPQNDAAARAALVAALFFQGTMTFQIYPRGGYNISLMLGTLAPIFSYLAWRGYALATRGPARTGPVLRATAFALVASIPALFVLDRVQYAVTAPSASELPQRALRHPALAGIHPKPEVWEQPKLEAFNALTLALERAEPRDAPLFVLHNEPMHYFLSDRAPLFADHIQTFFLQSWEMWPPHDPATPAAADLIRDFENHPDAIIVTRRHDKTARFIFRAYPSLRKYISENYRTTGRFGEYRVLRRANVE